jgi:hypothetical protein
MIIYYWNHIWYICFIQFLILFVFLLLWFFLVSVEQSLNFNVRILEFLDMKHPGKQNFIPPDFLLSQSSYRFQLFDETIELIKWPRFSKIRLLDHIYFIYNSNLVVNLKYQLFDSPNGQNFQKLRLFYSDYNKLIFNCVIMNKLNSNYIEHIMLTYL